MCMWMCVERGEGEAGLQLCPRALLSAILVGTSVVSSIFGKQGGNVKGRPSGSEA